MLDSNLFSSVTRITEVAERQLAQLDGVLYSNERKNSATERCEYCETLARKSAGLALQSQREHELLSQEVEKALHLAATAYAAEEKIINSEHHKKSLPKKTSAVTCNKSLGSSRHTLLCSRTPIEPPSVPKQTPVNIHQPSKVRFIPAHHKAPYKTVICKSNSIVRKQAPIVSSRHKCSKIPEAFPTKHIKPEPAVTPTISRASIDFTASIELPAISTSCKHDSNKIVSDSLFADDFGSHESLNTHNHEQVIRNTNCVCKQKVRSELEKEFFIALRRLLTTIREYRPIIEITNTKEFYRHFYHQFLRDSDPSTVNSFLRRKCEELTRLTEKFCQHLSCLDSESTDSKQRDWIHHVTTRILTVHRYVRFVYDNICRDTLHKQVPLPQIDIVGQWIAAKKGGISSEPCELYDNPFLESYLATGPPPSKCTPSRLLALTNTPELCVFDGNQQDVAHFLLLWSELELINVETKLFSELRERLPQIKNEIENKSKNRASAFREVYGLICGICPIALKDSFNSKDE